MSICEKVVLQNGDLLHKRLVNHFKQPCVYNTIRPMSIINWPLFENCSGSTPRYSLCNACQCTSASVHINKTFIVVSIAL